jgi:hypothetical protein
MLMINLLFSSLLGSAAAEPPVLSKLVIEPCEYGDVYQFSTVSCEVELRNIGKNDIHVVSAAGIRPKDSVAVSNILVPANGVASFRVNASVEDDIGFSKHFFSLVTDEVGQEKRYAEAKGFVSSVVDSYKPEVDFGIVDLSKELPVKELSLTSTDVEGFEIASVVEAPKYLDVSVGKDRKSISVAVKKEAPWGLFEKDRILLAVSSSIQTRVAVRVKADFRGEVVPSLNPVPIGQVRNDVTNEFVVKLTSDSNKPFAVGKVEISGFSASTRIIPCEPSSDGCKEIRVRIPPSQPTGQVGGLISVELPDFGRSLSIYAWGMLLAPDVKIVDLYEEMNKRKLNSVDGKKDGSDDQVDIGSLLKSSVVPAPAELVPPPGKGPLVKWSVANEEMLYAYSVFRAKAEDGPYVRVNKSLIRVLPGSARAGRYQWRDTNASSGTTYWYYVGYVDRSGKKAKLTAPQKVVVK